MGFDLVDLRVVAPEVLVELRYATSRNFLGRPLYGFQEAWLRPEAATRLAAADLAARTQGFRLKVWDAFRPASAQRAMWQACPNPRFVAPPERGSRHTRGVSVDVTLVGSADEAEVPMGTDFDDFTERAAGDFPGLPEEVRRSRAQLRQWMMEAGFQGIASEWWHFDLVGWERFPLLDFAHEDSA